MAQREADVSGKFVIGIWEQLEPIVSQNGCSLERVRVFETENNYADYYGES